MKNRERFFCLLTLTLVILALLAGCGSQDSDLQDTDEIIYEYDYRRLLQLLRWDRKLTADDWDSAEGTKNGPRRKSDACIG